jgi:serine protease AprX
MWKRSLLRPLVLLCALILAGLNPAVVPAGASGALDPALPVHPALQYGAQQEPTRRVRVIVQKNSASVSNAAITKALGAKVLEEFRFINTFVMEIPQSKVLVLGRTPGVRYVSPDAPIKKVGGIYPEDLTNLKTTYQRAIGAHLAWDKPYEATGNGVVVALLDTGLDDQHPGLGSNKTCVNINQKSSNCYDDHGHGTHVAGIIKGWDGDRRYLGIAPNANLISIKVADASGAIRLVDLLRGLEYVSKNVATGHKIRVLNLSLSMNTPESYANSPVNAAVEALWHQGVVVVASAGNRGGAADATHYAPGNDPFVITVGALDHNETTATGDDRLADFSSRGRTQDGFAKPEIVAPGRKIVAPLAGREVTLRHQFPDRITDRQFIRMSGTSMSAPVVTGVVALLLEAHPRLTPNQVKYLLTATANPYPGQADAAGMVDPIEALQRAAQGGVPSANAGIARASSIAPTTRAATGATGDQAYWDQAYWDQAYWDQAYWDQAYWDQAYWDESAVEAFSGD